MAGSQMRKRRSAYLVVGGLSVAVTITALASAQAAPTPAPKVVTPASCAPTPGVDAKTLKVGMITSLTGPSAPGFAGAYEAVALRVAQENAKGGIFGRKLVLSKYDDASNGAGQITAESQAVDRDQVLAINYAAAVDTMFPALKALNLPAFGTGLPPAATDFNVFGSGGPGSNTLATTALVKRLATTGATKLAGITFPVPAAVQNLKNTLALAPLAGMSTVLTKNDAPFGAYDATSTALAIRASGADGVIAVLQPDGGVSVFQALAQQGITLKALNMPGLSDPALVTKAGPGVNGVISSTYGSIPPGVTGRPGFRTYNNAMLAAGFNPYGANPPMSYISADTMIKSIKAAGVCPTRTGIVNAAHKVKSFDGAGVLPKPVNYIPSTLGPNGTPGNCSWFVTIVNQKIVPDKEPTCGDLVEVATGKVVLKAS
ncbi:MAG: ABC transporter substrate-binding protein [Actinomycetes bacterium]|jgi:ABC-type branched-subunit amino acid transport system substrate-binding protein